MGLDMFLNGEKYLWTDWENPDNSRKEEDKRVSKVIVDLGYWRKHANLHGYIVQNFGGGEDECQRKELDADSLKHLIEVVKKPDEMPKTEGFFFGASANDQAQIDEDVKILTDALQWLETQVKGESRTVFYEASW